MNKELKIICSCGEMLIPDLSEDFNYKDIIHCDCGRKILIVDISE